MDKRGGEPIGQDAHRRPLGPGTDPAARARTTWPRTTWPRIT